MSKFRSYKTDSFGQVTIQWQTSNGSVVTVKHAFPRPSGSLVDAMNALIPFAAELADSKDDKRLFIQTLALKEGKKGKGDSVGIVAAMAIDGSEKAARLTFPKLRLGGEDQQSLQLAVCGEFRTAVNAALDECEAYVNQVKETIGV